MFARILEITPKIEKREELINTIRKDVLPILKDQAGFLELLPFVPEAVNERMLVISLWTERHDAERYAKEIFPKVEQLIKPYVTMPITFKKYNVETRLCEHLVEVLTVAA